MWDQVVALEYKAYGMVAVSVPILVFEIFCGGSVDDEIAACILIQPANYYIEKLIFSHLQQ